MPSWFFELPSDVGRLVLEWLSLKGLARLDTATCTSVYRKPALFKLLSGLFVDTYLYERDWQGIRWQWMAVRGIVMRTVYFDAQNVMTAFANGRNKLLPVSLMRAKALLLHDRGSSRQYGDPRVWADVWSSLDVEGIEMESSLKVDNPVWILMPLERVTKCSVFIHSPTIEWPVLLSRFSQLKHLSVEVNCQSEHCYARALQVIEQCFQYGQVESLFIREVLSPESGAVPGETAPCCTSSMSSWPSLTSLTFRASNLSTERMCHLFDTCLQKAVSLTSITLWSCRLSSNPMVSLLNLQLWRPRNQKLRIELNGNTSYNSTWTISAPSITPSETPPLTYWKLCQDCEVLTSLLCSFSPVHCQRIESLDARYPTDPRVPAVWFENVQRLEFDPFFESPWSDEVWNNIVNSSSLKVLSFISAPVPQNNILTEDAVRAFGVFTDRVLSGAVSLSTWRPSLTILSMSLNKDRGMTSTMLSAIRTCFCSSLTSMTLLNCVMTYEELVECVTRCVHLTVLRVSAVDFSYPDLATFAYDTAPPSVITQTHGRTRSVKKTIALRTILTIDMALNSTQCLHLHTDAYADKVKSALQYIYDLWSIPRNSNSLMTVAVTANDSDTESAFRAWWNPVLKELKFVSQFGR